MRAHADSWCVSSDVGHSVHPNYASRHDPQVQPVLGSGPILKINANQRYATDSIGAFIVKRLVERRGGKVQEFEVRNDMGCGSTVGRECFLSRSQGSSLSSYTARSDALPAGSAYR